MIKEINDFFKNMKDFKYGWLDKNNNKHINKISKKEFITDYRLQNYNSVKNNKIGICWDQVEYERHFFNQKQINFKTIMIIFDDKTKYLNHTFLVFKYNNNYYWFENVYKINLGINKYASLKDCLEDVKKAFLKQNNLNKNTKPEYYIYSKPKENLSCKEFFEHCFNGIIIKENEIKKIFND